MPSVIENKGNYYTDGTGDVLDNINEDGPKNDIGAP